MSKDLSNIFEMFLLLGMFIYLENNVIKGHIHTEVKREIIYPFFTPQSGHIGYSQARPKTGASSFFRVSHVDSGVQLLDLSCDAF